MGTVYLASDRETGDRVALKLMHSADGALADRFVLEARLLADVQHPNIVRHIAHGQIAGGGFFLAMEWLEGMDLAQRLRAGRLDVTDALALAERVAAAL